MDVAARGQWAVEDHVSLAERLRALLWSRATIAVATLVSVAVLVEQLDPSHLLAVALFGLLFAVDLRTRTRLRRGIRPSDHVLTTAVLVEGLAIVTALHLAGGDAAAVRPVLIIHAVTTTLLLSRQIGVQSAVWVSMLLLASHGLQEFRLATGAELAGLLAAIWLGTLLTARAATTNERVLLSERLDRHVQAFFGQAAEASRAPVETARVLAEHVLRTGPIQEVLVVDLREDPVVLARRGGPTTRRGAVGAGAGSILDQARRRRQPVHVQALDPDADPELRTLLDAPRNVTAMPLIADDEVLGALVVVHGEDAARGIQRRTVEGHQRLAGHGALALANAWAAEELDLQARTDRLTGVANRHTFDEQFDKELERARRERSPLSVVLCDVDHFKKFNDEHGHQVGDDVLAEVAQALQSRRRPYDLVARYGGEEFAIILSRTDLEAALRVAERLRRAVEETGSHLGVTASFGVASAVGTVPRSELISTADACLYLAKENGRNRVEGTSIQPLQTSAAEGPTAGAGDRADVGER